MVQKKLAKTTPKKGREPMGERRCDVCGAAYDGAYLWDVHVSKGGALVDTCSPRCRVDGGYKERKATA